MNFARKFCEMKSSQGHVKDTFCLWHSVMLCARFTRSFLHNLVSSLMYPWFVWLRVDHPNSFFRSLFRTLTLWIQKLFFKECRKEKPFKHDLNIRDYFLCLKDFLSTSQSGVTSSISVALLSEGYRFLFVFFVNQSTKKRPVVTDFFWSFIKIWVSRCSRTSCDPLCWTEQQNLSRTRVSLLLSADEGLVRRRKSKGQSSSSHVILTFADLAIEMSVSIDVMKMWWKNQRKTTLVILCSFWLLEEKRSCCRISFASSLPWFAFRSRNGNREKTWHSWLLFLLLPQRWW
jgi:hypothetical protein